MGNGAKLHLSQPKASLVIVAYQEVRSNQCKKNLILEFQIKAVIKKDETKKRRTWVFQRMKRKYGEPYEHLQKDLLKE